MAVQIKAKPHSQNELSEEQQKEMQFIYNHFMNYIKMNDRFRPTKYKYKIFYQVLEYTKDLFSLSELYGIYLTTSPGCYEYNKLVDLKAKIEDSSNSEKFKKTIEELNPIILNILVDLIHYSNFFYDDEEGFRMPEVINNEIALDRWD